MIVFLFLGLFIAPALAHAAPNSQQNAPRVQTAPHASSSSAKQIAPRRAQTESQVLPPASSPAGAPSNTPLTIPAFAPPPVPVPSAPIMFPFALPPFDSSQTATNVSFLNAERAGARGFVGVRGEHFVDGQGNGLRLWGVNLNFNGAFPEKTDAPRIAARLAKFGFNAVRLHHYEGNAAPTGIWRAAATGSTRVKFPREFDLTQLDRFDFFINELIKAGIYIDLNLHVARKTGVEEGVSAARALPDKDKAVNYFDANLVKLHKEFCRAILTHVNPYTGRALKDEPGVCALEVSNENSLLGTWLDNALRMPPEYSSALRTRWNAWLAKKYTPQTLRAAWTEVDDPISGMNLIAMPLPIDVLNPDAPDARLPVAMSLLPRFQLATVTGAVGRVEVDAMNGPTVDGFVRPGLTTSLQTAGTVSWAFQLNRDGLNLDEGQAYTLSFWARADMPRRISVNLWQDRKPNRFAGFTGYADLTVNWEKYTFVFRPSNPEANHSRLSWNLGNQVGTIQFGEIDLRRGGRIAAPDNWTLPGTPRPNTQPANTQTIATMPINAPIANAATISTVGAAQITPKIAPPEAMLTVPQGAQVPPQATPDYAPPMDPGAVGGSNGASSGVPLLEWKSTPVQVARRDFAEFLGSIERETVADMRSFLKTGLGVRVPIWHTQAQFGGWGGVAREMAGDAIDVHAYWKHPDFGAGGGWSGNNWKVGNASMTSAAGVDPLSAFALFRVAGKPFVMSEWNSGQPNDFGAESLLMVSAYAAWQDWAAVYLFDYHSNGAYDRDKFENFFSIDSQPVKMATAPAAALLFRRPNVLSTRATLSGPDMSTHVGDLALAQDVVTLSLPREMVWNEIANLASGPTAAPLVKSWTDAGASRAVPLQGKAYISFGGGVFARASRAENGDPKTFISDSGQMIWDKKTSIWTANAPRSKVAIGTLGGKTTDLDEWRIAMPSSQSNWAAFALSSLDGQEIARSRRLLLTACGKAENTGMGWNADRSSVGAQWGSGPTQVEGLAAQMRILTDEKSLRVWALDTTGARRVEVPSTLRNGVLTFEASPVWKTLWYEIGAS